MSVGLAVTGLVKGVEQSCIDQGPRPDHAWRPNHKLSQNAANAKSNNLTTDSEEYLVAEGDHLTVEDLLGQGNFSGVGTHTRDISHDCNADVLLDVKGAGVEWPYITECSEAFGRENPSETKAEGKTNE